MKRLECVDGVEPLLGNSLRAREGARRAVSRRPIARRWPLLAFVCMAWACGNDTSSPSGPAEVPNFGSESPPAAGGSGGGVVDTPSSGEGEGAVGTPSSGEGEAVSGSIPLAPNAAEPDPGNGPVGAAGATAGAADAEPAELCTIIPNPGSTTDGDANIDLAAELQRIAGFGGMDGGFYDELTADQVDTAFGNGPGQLGLSIIRIRVPEDATKFGTSLAAAKRAAELGATVMATPWSPPANLKSNADTIGGSLNVASYGAYADHLLAFRDFMQSNGVPLYAISVQNEPDIQVTYASCDWTANQVLDWVRAEGPRFGDTKLIAAESFHFDHNFTDPILNDATAAAQVDIIAGHIYGSGLSDYPLARQRGKEVWMTEHFTESANPANAWPLALDVGTEIHNVMAANFSAYVWWAIRRSYGLITEDGVASKRGYLEAQYSKFIRPGFVRVRATQPSNANVVVTAYKGGNQVVVVAVNRSAQAQPINLDLFNSCATSLSRFTTSATKDVASDGPVALASGKAAVTLDGQSVTTFVSQ